MVELLGSPLRGNVVSFPRAIPDRAWVMSRLLWADRLGALWPTWAPTPMRQGDEDVLQDLEQARAAGLFTEWIVPEEAYADVMDSLRQTRILPKGRANRWLRKAGALTDQANPQHANREGAPERDRSDPNLFFYWNKLPPDVTDQLVDAGVLRRHGEFGVRARSLSAAAAVFSTAVTHARPNGEIGTSTMIPDADSTSALWQAAMPLDEQGHPATAVQFPLATPLRNDVSVEKLLEFRQKPAVEAARQDYLAGLASFASATTTTRDSEQTRTKAMADKAAKDVERASEASATASRVAESRRGSRRRWPSCPLSWTRAAQSPGRPVP